MKAVTISFCNRCGASFNVYHWDTAWVGGADWEETVREAIQNHRAYCAGSDMKPQLEAAKLAADLIMANPLPPDTSSTLWLGLWRRYFCPSCRLRIRPMPVDMGHECVENVFICPDTKECKWHYPASDSGVWRYRQG